MENIYKYLLSIIIPTRNRQQYALSAVRNAYKSTDYTVQIIIQDNSDNDDLRSAINEEFIDERVLYDYKNDELSFVDNFSYGVENANGEYLCIIGDDDGICSDIVEVVRWAKRNHIEAITPSLPLSYTWPKSELTFKGEQTNQGTLAVSVIRQYARLVKPRQSIRKLISNGCQDYYKYDMVKLYHGIVKATCMVEIKKRTGHYFGGLSPDIYNAVALSLVVSKVLCLNYPLTISGICPKSGSADSASGRHTGLLKDAPHFRGQSNYGWADEVPRFYSVQTIWADTALAALHEMGEDELVGLLRMEVLTIHSIRKNPGFKGIALKHYYSYGKRKKRTKAELTLLLYSAFFEVTLKEFVSRIVKRIKRGIHNNTIYQNISNIEAAAKMLEKHKEDRKINIDGIMIKLQKIGGGSQYDKHN